MVLDLGDSRTLGAVLKCVCTWVSLHDLDGLAQAQTLFWEDFFFFNSPHDSTINVYSHLRRTMYNNTFQTLICLEFFLLVGG